MMGKANIWWVGVGALLLSAGVVYLGYGIDRTSSLLLILAFTLSFGGYALVVGRAVNKLLLPLIGLGIALRLLLVFAFPLLSDDVYRFLWDGYLILDGQNPFVHLPAYYLEAGNEVAGLTPELFTKLNSPDYYTIYPPVAQGVFTGAVALFPEHWYGAAVVIKLFLFACELGSLWLLWRLLGDHFGGERYRLLYYWLNPLIIVEITGNLHFEGAMVFFLLLGYFFLWRNEWVRAGLAVAASVASKLLPLLLLPYLIRRLWSEGGVIASQSEGEGLAASRVEKEGGIASQRGGESLIASRSFMDHRVTQRKHRVTQSFRRWSVGGEGVWPSLWRRGRAFWVFSLAIGVGLVAFFAPLLLSPGFLSGFQSSLELYQQKFEFNASLYYLTREVGYWQVGWNLIATLGPFLAKLSAVGILVLALLDGRSDWRSLAEGWMFAFILYLLCATTVHPWYLSVPLVLCVFTRWRFPLVWSYLITLTYASYATVPYAENLWLVAVEYTVVIGWFWWEWRKRKAGHSKPSVLPPTQHS